MDHNRNFAQLCDMKNMLLGECLEPENRAKLCSFMPRRLVKTNHLLFKEVAQLLLEPDMKKLKVILFVRDPRGIFHSQRTSDVCQLPQFKDVPSCKNEKEFCKFYNEGILGGNFVEIFYHVTLDVYFFQFTI